MNLFDLVILVLAVSAGIGGYRLGLVARALSWTCMAIGIVITARFLPDIIDAIKGPDPTGRLLIAVAVLLAGAFVGQAIGLLLGSKIHLVMPPQGRPFDSAGGAIAGVLGVLVGVWLLLPTMGDVPGQMARQARNSSIARFIATNAPDPPNTVQALRRLIGENGYPRVFAALKPTPDIGEPPAETGLSKQVLDSSILSTVRVEGPACGRIQEGSGFVAAPGIVVTNAHVVAGETKTTLIERSGRSVSATVIHFDPDRDLAVLAADVRGTPLPVAGADQGDKGAVLGYPGGGPLTVSPYQVGEVVTAVGRDLYDKHQTRRQVLILASDLRPGDSGAALVDAKGQIAGVAFAIAPDRPGTSYALATSELKAALTAPRQAKADTGPCLR